MVNIKIVDSGNLTEAEAIEVFNTLNTLPMNGYCISLDDLEKIDTDDKG